MLRVLKITKNQDLHFHCRKGTGASPPRRCHSAICAPGAVAAPERRRRRFPRETTWLIRFLDDHSKEISIWRWPNAISFEKPTCTGEIWQLALKFFPREKRVKGISWRSARFGIQTGPFTTAAVSQPQLVWVFNACRIQTGPFASN